MIEVAQSHVSFSQDSVSPCLFGFSLQDGSYKRALVEFEGILSDLLGRYGEKHERVGAALHNVAIANLRAGSLDDSMDAIEEAIKIRSRALGRSHPRVAVSGSTNHFCNGR